MFKSQNLLKLIHKRLIIFCFENSSIISLKCRFDIISFSNDNTHKMFKFGWSILTFHWSSL